MSNFTLMSSSQTILVTGAGGFIGSYLVEALVGRGEQVRAFVRYRDWRPLVRLSCYNGLTNEDPARLWWQ